MRVVFSSQNFKCVSFEDEVLGQMINEAYERCVLFGQISREVLRNKMASSRGGITYPSGHTASAPGEFPAIEFGKLMQSITYDVTIGSDVVTVTMGSSSPYADILEFGNRRIARRPWMSRFKNEECDKVIKRAFQSKQWLSSTLGIAY